MSDSKVLEFYISTSIHNTFASIPHSRVVELAKTDFETTLLRCPEMPQNQTMKHKKSRKTLQKLLSHDRNIFRPFIPLILMEAVKILASIEKL